MRPRRLVGPALALALLAGVALAAEPPAAEPEGSFGSPKAVFDAAVKASAKKDYKALLACMTPESRERFTGELAALGVMVRAVPLPGGEKAVQDKLDGLDKIFAKHGLTR